MERRTNLSYLIKIAILGGLAGAIMMLKLSLPIFPGFLSLDLSDLPAVIGALILGPLAGLLIEGVKVIANLIYQGSLTLGLGELANFLSGAAFILPLGFVYKKYSSLKGVVMGGFLGVLSMTIVMSISNYYFFLPVYEMQYYMDFVEIGSQLKFFGKYIDSMFDFILFGMVPFNVIKGTSIVLITLATHNYIIPPLKKMQARR